MIMGHKTGSSLSSDKSEDSQINHLHEPCNSTTAAQKLKPLPLSIYIIGNIVLSSFNQP